MPLHIIKESEEFSPHMAVTSMLLNDGAANKRNLPVIQKSKIKSDKEIELLKFLKASPAIIEKASVENMRKMISAALKDKFGSDDDCCYTWVWLRDFDPVENKAIFEMDDKTYVIGFSLQDNGLLELEDDMEEAIHHDVYTTASTNDLILKGANADEEQKDSETDSEVVTEIEGEPSDENPKEKLKEDNMSDKTEAPVEFTKAQKDQIAQLLKAEREAVKQEMEAAELLKSTKESLGSLEFIDEGDIEVFAKGLVANTELMSVVLKSLNSAKDALAAKEVEMEEIKKEFATAPQSTVEGETEVTSEDPAAILKAKVAQLKAKA